ncbi:hypothetical protein K474DRAFT_1664739 [Panus rudis PR-1116 ss-1]|nr:hypothetical protein K474DRAFT_1664739 [Panus rudis PR-1116 ss-1]
MTWRIQDSRELFHNSRDTLVYCIPTNAGIYCRHLSTVTSVIIVAVSLYISI